MKKRLLLFMAAALAATVLALPRLATAGSGDAGPYVPESDPLVRANLEHWQDLKFGLLMHWGAYSQWGIVESWSICPEDEGWCRRSLDDYYSYVRKYEDLKKTFNPVLFDPAKWARAAGEAGMRYVVFTTKHHDGFCMFDSKYTDYKITSPDCPFHSDPRADAAKAVFDAFRRQGFMVGAYFSKPDWHSEYYWWPNFPPRDRNVNYDPAVYPERWKKFIEFVHGQIMELMTNYGQLDILWLDGGWVAKKSPENIAGGYRDMLAASKTGYFKSQIIDQDIRMDDLVAECRAKQPGLIVVDRAVPGRNQNYLTPENAVPDKALPYPWESCITSGGGWSFTRDAVYMDGRKAIHLLADIVAKGGNLLLNIAPGPDGTWQPGAYAMLKDYADWMKINSRAIYATRAVAPFAEGRLRYTRAKNGTIFAIYLADESEAVPASIVVPSFRPDAGGRVVMLGGKERLAWKPRDRGCEVFIPEKLRQAPPCAWAWVIDLGKAGTAGH